MTSHPSLHSRWSLGKLIAHATRLPIVKGLLRRFVNRPGFRGSADYWEERYTAGESSGMGSYGQFAEFKAAVINGFVAKNEVVSVTEFGCGDGNQLSLMRYPHYNGLDVSATVVQGCRERFRGDASKRFFHYHPDRSAKQLQEVRADL